MQGCVQSYEALREAFGVQTLFENKTWRYSPEAWLLSSAEARELEEIGVACLEFYRAVDLLYGRSVDDKTILRNRELKAPWVAGYLDRGKPSTLVAHARHPRLRGSHPVVIRPDLLVTDEGFALTEVDSVPGGVGLTAFLNRLYAGSPGLVGEGDAMIEGFYESLAALRPDRSLPLIALVVSEEAATYRPEMEWLAGELQARGRRVYCFDPDQLMPLGDALCADVQGNPEEVDVVYRFWELFDHDRIPVAPYIMEMLENGAAVSVSPPMRAFQEEKLNLALFHHHLLEDFWRENLSRRSLRILRRIIPRGWIMDPVDLPPNAVLDGPLVGGKPIHRWEQLSEASQRERNLIMKLSGFHENAWGARSVLLGSDASRDEWREGLLEAMKSAPENLYILQEYKKPARRKHPVFSPQGRVQSMEGRVRLCPYYFVLGDQARLGGVLATFCPADKKIIHGMRDAAMLPVRVAD
ncbi:MAG: hypothetical protein JJT96_04830 [Opitutales bacterium]|nr:hypothetical protein [Opitutales bacterium]